MDLVKLLSRGTTPTVRLHVAGFKSLANSAPAPPTAQQNPQLYNDAIADSRGVKRKWAVEAAETPSDDESSDVDFFAPKDSNKEVAETSTENEGKQGPGESEEATPKVLSEEECRQIFRSHRLKVTVRTSLKELPGNVTRGRKKKERKANGSLKRKRKPVYLQPLNSFSELRTNFGVSPKLAGNIRKQAYKIPTEVQLGSLPLLLRPVTALINHSDSELTPQVEDGLDFLAVAPTGSGKTITYLIPTLDAVLKRKFGEKPQKQHVLQALIVAPTRELATQIALEGRKLAAGTRVSIFCMKKGMDIAATSGESRVAPRRATPVENYGADSDHEGPNEKDEPGRFVKADVLVTTPRLLLNVLKGRTLPDVRQLVLDEADVLLDSSSFLDQTMCIWDACTNKSMRISCWSATMASNVEDLITDKLESRAESLGAYRVPLLRLVVGLKDTAVPNIEHKLVYAASEEGKRLGLLQLLRPAPGDSSAIRLDYPILIFAQNIERATALFEEFKYELPLSADGSSRMAVLHSCLSEGARSAIMARFRAGEVWALVSTDLLMRGIDLPGLKGVVNYDIPQSSAAYVHRAGRTGRAGRSGGIAVTFYTKEDIPYVKTIANIINISEKQAGKSEDEASIKKWLLDALPDLKKDDKHELKKHGVPERRPMTGSAKQISSLTYGERRKENYRRAAIEASRRRKPIATQRGRADDSGQESEWGGLDD